MPWHSPKRVPPRPEGHASFNRRGVAKCCGESAEASPPAEPEGSAPPRHRHRYAVSKHSPHGELDSTGVPSTLRCVTRECRAAVIAEAMTLSSALGEEHPTCWTRRPNLPDRCGSPTEPSRVRATVPDLRERSRPRSWDT